MAKDEKAYEDGKMSSIKHKHQQLGALVKASQWEDKSI